MALLLRREVWRHKIQIREIKGLYGISRKIKIKSPRAKKVEPVPIRSISSKITLTKEKERPEKKRKSEEEEKRRREKKQCLFSQ